MSRLGEPRLTGFGLDWLERAVCIAQAFVLGDSINGKVFVVTFTCVCSRVACLVTSVAVWAGCINTLPPAPCRLLSFIPSLSLKYQLLCFKIAHSIHVCLFFFSYFKNPNIGAMSVCSIFPQADMIEIEILHSDVVFSLSLFFLKITKSQLRHGYVSPSLSLFQNH